MVESQFIRKILRQLEKYLITKNDFYLRGNNYDLILIQPSDKYQNHPKYSLYVSAKILDQERLRDVITELLNQFKEALDTNEYSSISRINLIHSSDPFVSSINALPFQETIYEMDHILISGVLIRHAYWVKSRLLDKLVENNAVTLRTVKNQSNNIGVINAGVIRMEKNFDLVYYTGKGLREIFGPNADKTLAHELLEKSEKDLIAHDFIAKINFDQIAEVI